jgi:outer membrane protein assembly factor BamB
MKFWLSALTLSATLAVANPGIAAFAQSSSVAAGTDWPMANLDYANTRAVAPGSLFSSNVGQLGIAWTFDVPGVSTFGALATAPVVVNQTVYVQDLQSNVYAIDLQTGTLKWQKLYNADNLGPNGPAVDAGKVFIESDAKTVTALDANSGDEVWSAKLATPADSQGVDQQLTVFGGTVYVSTVPGSSVSNFYAGGGMGIIYALDEQTGKVKWSFNTVKDGDLWGHPDVNSGGGAWYPPAIDTSTGETYWGIGNPAPFPGTAAYPNGSSRPGENLYTNAAIALDANGQLQWYKQVKPRDITDGDFEAPPILANVPMSGAARDIVIGAGKAGYVAAFDKQSGELLWKTGVGVHQNDDLQSFPADSTVHVFPGEYGGVETPMAFADGTVYVPVVNAGTDYSATTASATHFSTGTGELVAIDAATGNIVWKAELPSLDFGGATVAGDLVFTSTYSGSFLAFDRGSGTQVWTWQAPGGINGLPAVAGDTVLLPVGLASTPQLIALKVGASGSAAPASQPAAQATPPVALGSQPATTQLSVATSTDNPLAFDTATLQVAAGADVNVTYTNDSPIQHNWHAFNGSDANTPSLAQTPVKSGPQDVESVQFTAPTQAGNYYFQCDVHPFMNGQLVVTTASP